MLSYLEGDATFPTGDGHRIIAHICNDVGGWGRGFVVAVSKRWKEPELGYRAWFAKRDEPSDNPFGLGHVLFVPVADGLDVANMVAQHDIRTYGGVPPIRYEALRDCLLTVKKRAIGTQATIHMPRIGCGLAGGEWSKVEQLIEDTLFGIGVYVYDLPQQPDPVEQVT